MRPLRIDITGATDAAGNATIRVPLPQTGEWHDVKFALSLPGPAEWTVLVSGRPATFGRGRRVTLGPELVQDGETVTITVTGGPASSAIDGTAMGKSGDPLAIMASYTPAPNTIALDSLVTQRQLDAFTQAPNTVVNGRVYSLPAGTQSIRVQINQNQQVVTFTNFKVIGQGTGIVYIFPSGASGSTGGFDEWFKPAPPDVVAGISFSLDTTGSANGVEVIITADLSLNFVVAQLAGPGTSTGQPLLVNVTNPNVWRMPPDWSTNTVQNGAGGPASCFAPAQAGKIVVLNKATFSVSAGATRIFNARAWDGLSGTIRIGVQVIGDPGGAVETFTDSVSIEFVRGAVGAQMTFDFDFAAAAGEQQAISASGWYV